jgi:hypothetical protein
MKTTFSPNLMKKVVSSFYFLIICLNLPAQSGLNLYSDAGKSNTSNGLYIKSVVIGFFKSGKYSAQGGFQMDLDYNHHSSFSGVTVNLSRDFILRDLSFNLEGFFLRTRASEITAETNSGFLIKAGHNHFKTEFGINFRTYTFTNFAIRKYELDRDERRCSDVYNFIYSFRYDLKHEKDLWNVGMTITDADHFFMNQENNVLLNLHCSYKLRSSLSLYTEVWYEASGLTNLVVNNFGYFIRTGIIWNIN